MKWLVSILLICFASDAAAQLHPEYMYDRLMKSKFYTMDSVATVVAFQDYSLSSKEWSGLIVSAKKHYMAELELKESLHRFSGSLRLENLRDLSDTVSANIEGRIEGDSVLFVLSWKGAHDIFHSDSASGHLEWHCLGSRLTLNFFGTFAHPEGSWRYFSFSLPIEPMVGFPNPSYYITSFDYGELYLAGRIIHGRRSQVGEPLIIDGRVLFSHGPDTLYNWVYDESGVLLRVEATTPYSAPNWEETAGIWGEYNLFTVFDSPTVYRQLLLSPKQSYILTMTKPKEEERVETGTLESLVPRVLRGFVTSIQLYHR